VRAPVRAVQAFGSMELAIDDIDLEALARALRQRYGGSLYASYLRGKTVMRDAVVEQLGCSSYEAEELVETLEMMGYLRFPNLDDATHPLTRQVWVIAERSL
jgi:hypothetical protein